MINNTLLELPTFEKTQSYSGPYLIVVNPAKPKTAKTDRNSFHVLAEDPEELQDFLEDLMKQKTPKIRVFVCKLSDIQEHSQMNVAPPTIRTQASFEDLITP